MSIHSSPSPDDLITEHFAVREMAYRRRGRLYLPCGDALDALRRTCGLVLEPLRQESGAPIYVLPGGGYDPLRDPATDEWISHRTSSTTQHHLGGAVDFRIGARSATQPWQPGWGLEETVRWLELRLRELGVPGGIGVYRTINNRFIHIDLRPWRARWQG